MPRSRRWQSFLVEPMALLNDPDFVRMRDLPDGSTNPLGERAQRAYMILWLASWSEKEPGVIPHLPGPMARTVGLDVSDWLEIEPLVRPAVKVREADGAWVFPILVKQAEKQDREHKRKSASGKLGAKARWDKEKDGGAIHDGHASSASASASASASTAFEPAIAVSPLGGVALSRGAVLNLSDRLAMPGPRRPAAKPRDGHDAARVDRIANGLPPPGRTAVHKFAGWLWSTGTHDDDLIDFLVRHRLEVQPDNPYAFYATDGEARLQLETQFREERAGREKRDHDAADATFLSRG